jgi:hypothetical protein
MLFDTAQMPFVMLKRPFDLFLFLIILFSTEEKNPEEREHESKCPKDALLFFFAFLS